MSKIGRAAGLLTAAILNLDATHQISASPHQNVRGSAMQPQKASRPPTVTDFVSSLGVVTHIPYTDGRYANVHTIISNLNYLGVSRVRDEMNTPGQFGGAPFSSYVKIAQAGIKFVLSVGGGGTILTNSGQPTAPSLDQRVSYIANLALSVPGSIIGVEGTNEVNNQPIAYAGFGTTGHGQDELDAALAMQRDLYSLVHGNAALQGVPVYYFTGYDAGTIPTGPDPATALGLADANNQHPYPNSGQAPAIWVSRRQALKNEGKATLSSPAVYTETGYSSNGGTRGAVSRDVQAKYTLDLLLDCFNNGILSTYVYELMDAYAPDSPQGDAGFGLFDYMGAAKPVAVAIHNMNIILADKAVRANSFTPTRLAYTVSGKTATSYDMEMASSDKSYVIAIWDEQPIWDASSGSEIMATPHTETIIFGAGIGRYSVSVYNPIVGTTPISEHLEVSQISVTLTDCPILLIVTSVQ